MFINTNIYIIFVLFICSLNPNINVGYNNSFLEQDTISYIEILKKYKNKNYFNQNIHNRNISDAECVGFAMYGESRGEGVVGMLAVAFVIHNRLNKWKIKNYCEVVRQPSQFQFIINPPKTSQDEFLWVVAITIAYYLINNHGFIRMQSPVHNALYFNSLPKQYLWNNHRYVKKIGNHYFYQ